MTIEIETTPAPIETVTPIRPSEAIRLGCLTTAQAFSDYGNGDAACAVGAMNIGFGLQNDAGDHLDDISHLHRGTTVCPETGQRGCPGRWHVMVFHLNDDHRWSRERIADWLEGLGL